MSRFLVTGENHQSRSVSFREKNSQKRVIPGKKRSQKRVISRRKTPIQEHVIPGPDPESSLPLCICAFVPSPCVILGPDPESSLPLCLCAFPLCHSWPRPGIQPAFESFPPLCLCASVPLCLPLVPLCLCASVPLCLPLVPLCLPLVSFRAQTRNPVCLCAFVPLCLPLVSFRAQTRNPVCLCAFVPLCLPLVSFRAQTRNPVCLCAFVPLCLCAFPLCHSGQKTAKNVSFRAKNGQKRVISGEKHPSRSMSFRAKTTNPETCHSGPRPGIQGRSRHSGFLLARKIARYFFSFFTRPENPIPSSE